jgi:hypothetical protein
MNLRNEALLMLDKRGTVLDTARRISALLRDNEIAGAVIGGVAVVLHGHIRTTKDVDLYVRQPFAELRPVLEASGAAFDPVNREFVLNGVPIHLVGDELVQPTPRRTVIIEDVTTVSLADLISIKLRSGLSKVTRAQDIADVIGLIEHHKLGGTFVTRIDKSVRAEFKRLLKAVRENR